MKAPKISINKDSIKNGLGNAIDFIIKQKRYFMAGLVFVLMMVLLFGFTAPEEEPEADPMEGVYENYTENENEELANLINGYYTAYAAGNTDTLQTLATPISDEEISYIQFYSQYIDNFGTPQIFTKRGLDDTSYIVSVVVNLKFVDIDTPAPGFDFFYVQTNEDGALYINNVYGSFNQSNLIYEMDTDITTMIATFIQQEDVLAKQAEVQQAYNEAILSDENLNNFVTNTLQDAIVQWNVDYQAQVAAAEAEAAAAAEAEAQAQAEAEAQAQAEAAAAEEEANAYYGTTTDKINVRESADTSSSKLGQLDKGTQVKIYAEEGDWYKIDYDGNRAYVMKEYVEVDENATTTEETTEETTDEDTSTDTTFAEGEEITLTSSVNIRESMDSSSSKVAVAYPGETVTVVMCYSEGWTKVKYGKKEGYIRTDLLTE